MAGGAITIETIFSWPGLGELSFNAINDKDFPVLQGTFLVFSAGVILANLLADCLYFFLDPRVQATMTGDGPSRREDAAVRHDLAGAGSGFGVARALRLHGRSSAR